MNELIKITENDRGEQVVSARELYQKLGYDLSQWSRWCKKNIEDNDFAIEFEDWIRLDLMSSGNKVKDFALKIEFAKKISMMARTEKGEEVRTYFIECEKKSKNIYEIPTTFSQALKLASEQAEKIEQQQLVISTQAPKVIAFENVIDSANTYTLDSVSDILNIGRTTLCRMLEEKKWKTIKETNGTSSTRYAEENGYAKTIYEYVKIGKNDIKTKRFVLKKKGLDKLLLEKQSA